MNNKFFNKILDFVVDKSKKVEIIFLVLVLISVVCYPFVNVNYDLSEYLPDYAPSRQALNVMEEEFGYPGLARIMVTDVSLYEAKAIRAEIEKLDAVDLVIGVDTFQNVYMSDSFINPNDIESFYKDGCATMQVVFKYGESDKRTHAALDEIYKIVGDNGHYAGSAVTKKSIQESVTKEISIAIVISLVIILLILTLTTTSWVEPFLFIFIMAIAIIINMGTNIIFGTISFFTFSTAAILQLAVSMDYSIFLLDTFTFYKHSGMEIKQALKIAVKESSSSILASSFTTIVGFIVLALMEFTVGKDMGFVLTKGIIISLGTVLFLMPALILKFYDKIEKYAHKPLVPSCDGMGKAMYRARKIVLVIAVLVAVPCYFGQDMNTFKYGDAAIGAGPGTKVFEDDKIINEKFGKSNMVLAIVPNTSNIKEKDLTETLNDFGFVNYALSLSGTLPEGIPESFLPQKLVEQLHTEDYARIILSMDTTEESDYAFDCAAKVQDTVKSYYGDEGFAIGMTTSTMDIKDILRDDYSKVSLISLAGVALVVFIAFKAFLVPILVIIPIEVAIYLNMTIPYLLGDTMTYIGYIIVSCLQLGATIDYAILMTNNYLSARKTMDRIEAPKAAISKSAMSIITSGSIITVVGYGLFFTSSVQGISQIGRLVARGALLSVMLVLSLLPALLSAFDKIIMSQQKRAENRSVKWQEYRAKINLGGK